MSKIPVENAPPNPEYDKGYIDGYKKGYEAAKEQIYKLQNAAYEKGFQKGVSLGYEDGIDRCFGALQALKDEDE